ncbi:hypothetical protein [Chengkuizengella marina]|uniref:Uncharacterized protein n=1 Tax=Chengkuizengella marina TaxID=2507566 RepID=A0A6N9Q7F7_9BACL|nr:hypothetical protein [Chengkuizengella marina]NBI30739.1 hypothetical protein [Chengkuizengella marina]
MKKYVVIRDFIDKNTKKHYKKGDFYESNQERATELHQGGFISEEEVKDISKNVLDQNANEVIKSITEEFSEKNKLKELFEHESSGKNRTTVLKHIESLLVESLS